MQIESGASVYVSYADSILQNSSIMKKISAAVLGSSDSPSSVGISERMRAAIQGQEAAARNTVSAISTMQTADSWLSGTGSMLDRMKGLSVKYNDGTLSDADKINTEVEFKSLQREVSRVSSKYTAAAKFNGLYLLRGGDGQPVTEGDGVGQGQAAVQAGPGVDQKTNLNLPNLSDTNTQVIGTVNRYEYDASNKVTASTHTDVTWNDITQMDISDEDAVGKIDAAVDYVADARASNAAKQKTMENTLSGLASSQSNLTESESAIRDVDEAFASIQLLKTSILSKAGGTTLKQGNELNAALLYKLLRG